MTITSISTLRHRTTPFVTLSFCSASFRNRFFSISAARHHQNPSSSSGSISRKLQPNRNLLKARETVKQLSTLAPVLSPNDKPNLSQNQAIGLVAAAQANFMRVIIQSLPPDASEASDSSHSEASSSLDEGLAGNRSKFTNSEASISSGEGISGQNMQSEDSRSFSEGNEEVKKAGVELLCVVKSVLKKIKRRVLVGDKVLVGSIDWVDRRGMIENVYERKSEVLDPPVGNVDHLMVVFSMDQPKIEPYTLTRFLVEAESTGIPLTLALNKCELADEKTLIEWKSRLRKWGYEPVFCSIESNHGLDTLQFILREQTSVIVGPSGVGKSSLINALRGNQHTHGVTEEENWFDPIIASNWLGEQRVGEVSVRSGRGKHTTRHVSLLPLKEGGYLADTPGFNQPSLIKVTKQSLAQHFPEIRKMLKDSEPEKCAFSNCLHLGEPGCCVKGDWERYSFYLQLLDEIRIREEFQLRTVGTKREGDMRYKVGEMGVMQAEPRLEPKKHRRQSRKRVNQSVLEGLDEYDDDDDEDLVDENPIIRAMREEHQ